MVHRVNFPKGIRSAYLHQLWTLICYHPYSGFSRTVIGSPRGQLRAGFSLSYAFGHADITFGSLFRHFRAIARGFDEPSFPIGGQLREQIIAAPISCNGILAATDKKNQ